MLRFTAAIAIGVAALILDPAGAFSDQGFDYTAKDMKAAIEGTWELTVEGKTTKFTLEQASTVAVHTPDGGLVRSAVACNQRTLVKSAAACIDGSQMPLEVRVVSGPFALPAKGTFMVYAKFDKGTLFLNSDSDWIRAEISPKGVATKVSIISPSKNKSRDGTLVRR